MPRLGSAAVNRSARFAAQGLFVPSLAACAAMNIELFTHFAVLPLIVFVLLSGDARWLGAFIGAMLTGGRHSLRTMRLVLGAAACGPTQLAIVAIGAHTWALPGETVLALVAGAVMIEITAPVRRSMAHRLAETEDQIRQDEP